LALMPQTVPAQVQVVPPLQVSAFCPA
jgi:hypothetical protein